MHACICSSQLRCLVERCVRFLYNVILVVYPQVNYSHTSVDGDNGATVPSQLLEASIADRFRL